MAKPERGSVSKTHCKKLKRNLVSTEIEGFILYFFVEMKGYLDLGGNFKVDEKKFN